MTSKPDPPLPPSQVTTTWLRLVPEVRHAHSLPSSPSHPTGSSIRKRVQSTRGQRDKLPGAPTEETVDRRRETASSLQIMGREVKTQSVGCASSQWFSNFANWLFKKPERCKLFHKVNSKCMRLVLGFFQKARAITGTFSPQPAYRICAATQTVQGHQREDGIGSEHKKFQFWDDGC